METNTINNRHDILKVYEDLNWEIRTLSKSEEYYSQIKPTIAESAGFNPPIFKGPGLVVQVPIEDNTPGSYLVIAYSSFDVHDQFSKPSAESNIINGLKEFKINYPEFPTEEEEIKKAIEESKEMFDKALCVIGRIFIIENENSLCSLGYMFIYDADHSVPLDSIVFKDDNELTLLLSQQFRDKFEDQSQAEYAINLVLSSISYILEDFK